MGACRKGEHAQSSVSRRGHGFGHSDSRNPMNGIARRALRRAERGEQEALDHDCVNNRPRLRERDRTALRGGARARDISRFARLTHAISRMAAMRRSTSSDVDVLPQLFAQGRHRANEAAADVGAICASSMRHFCSGLIGVTPGLSLATHAHRAPQLLNMAGRRRSASRVDIARGHEVKRTWHEPITSYGLSFSVRVRPLTSGEAEAAAQSWLMTTTRALDVFVCGEDPSERRWRAKHAPELAVTLRGPAFGFAVVGEASSR